MVANEVKTLAGQTAKATDEIAARVAEIQQSTADTITAFDRIGSAIRDVHGIAQEVGHSMRRQQEATDEVAGSVSGVTDATRSTDIAARSVRDIASSVAELADSLQGDLKEFLKST